MSSTGHLEINPMEDGSFFVKNTVTNKFVKMGPREVDYLCRFTHGLGKEAVDRGYEGDLTDEQREYLYSKFMEWDFIREPQEKAAKPKPKQLIAGLLRKDIAMIRLGSVNPDRLLDRCRPLISVLFNRVAAVIYLAAIIAAWGLLIYHKSDLENLSYTQLTAGDAILLYVMIIPTILIHEFAHAMACKHYGGKVNKLGFMLFYLNPAMYCDVSDTYLFTRKTHKAVVILAGIFSQWVLSALAVFGFFILTANGIDADLLLFYAFANVGISLLNLIPFVRLDGYWLLSTLLGITNLRSKSFLYLYSLLSGGRNYRERFPKSERRAFLFYGPLAAVYTVFLWGAALFGLFRWISGYSHTAGYWFLLAAGLIAAFYLFQFIKRLKDSLNERGPVREQPRAS